MALKGLAGDWEKVNARTYDGRKARYFDAEINIYVTIKIDGRVLDEHTLARWCRS